VPIFVGVLYQLYKFPIDMPDEKLFQALMSKEPACRLIAEYSNVYEMVMNISINELASIKGMGKAKKKRFQLSSLLNMSLEKIVFE
jgi:DNA repair protein RadC